MAYNKAREEQKWKKWKEREEEKLRELGMDEVSIQALHESDWADFNSERRYREHQMPLLDYVEMLLAETEVSETQIQSVEEEVLVKQLRVFYNKNDYVIGNKSKKEVPFPQEEVTVTVPA